MSAARLARAVAYAALAALALALAACRDTQSALNAQGPEAERVLLLTWVLFGGGTVILIGVILIAAAALYGAPNWRRLIAGERIIVVGGIVFPVVTLTILLAYGLLATRAGEAAPDEGEPLRIAVIGEQWWWRVIYTDAAGERFESANEIRIPTGRPVELALSTADVIHSFWVPNLAGKLDMIPGKTNVLRLTATAPGLSRGQCAEYCGGAHALMSFYVVAMPPEEFETWLANEAAPAPAPEGAEAEQGQMLFLANGCGACHAIRGTDAQGTIGPDLTHVGGRLSLAAATLPNDAEAIARWIEDNQHIKPENKMPPFEIFSESELAALSSYLAGLR